MSSNRIEPWIGLVEAAPGRPRPDGIDDDIAGAFTTFVCMAADPAGFRAAAALYLRGQGWLLVDAEDVEPVAQRLASWQPSADVMAAVDRVRRTGQPDTCDEWDLYPYGEH